MIKRILVLSAAIGAALALFAGPASAQYEVVFSATIDNVTPGPGETVTISGTCDAADSVDIGIDGSSIGSIPVDDDDSFSGSVTIPDLAPGTYTVTATCGDEVLGIEITIGGSTGGNGTAGTMTGGSDNGNTAGVSTDSGSNTGSGSSGSDALARTGGDTDVLLKVGGGLLLAGAAATLFATKRRSATA